MQDPISIVLEAINPGRNCARRWSIEVAADLFGQPMAVVAYGRIGAAGREQRRGFASWGEAARFARSGLCRRSTARRRIGAAYACIAANEAGRELLCRVQM